MAEERVVIETEDDEDGGSGLKDPVVDLYRNVRYLWLFGDVLAVILVGTVALTAFNWTGLDDVRQELDAKANSAYVAKVVAWMDSAKANWSDLDSARTSINGLLETAKTLNSRVVWAEGDINKNSRAAAAASSMAREARKLATEARELVERSKTRQASTEHRLDSLGTNLADSRREIDSRVGPVAADLSAFQREQAVIDANQDSIVTLIRAKTGLTDERMKQLAAAVQAKQKREAEKAAKMKEREERRKKTKK